MHVWLVAREVVGPPQRNGGNELMGHPSFGLGDPIVDFVHREVVLGALDGDVQDGEGVDVGPGVAARVYAVPSCSDCAIVAFVGEVVPDDPARREIVDNVVRAPLGTTLRWR